MSDFRIQFSLFTHIKLQKLEKALGDSGFASLIKLWFYAASIKSSTGELGGMDADDIETAARWRGAPGVFVDALLKNRLLDRDGDAYAIHDWAENNPWAAGAKVRCERARKGGFAKRDKDRQTASEQQNLLVARNQHCSISDPISITKTKRIDRSIPREKIYEQSEHLHSSASCPVADEQRTKIVEAALLADEDEGFDELLPDDAPAVSDAELMSGYEDKDKSKAIEERPASMEVMGIKIDLAMSSPQPSMTSQDESMPTAQAFAVLAGPPTESGPIPHKRRWAEKDAHLFAGEFPAIYLEPFAKAVDIAGEKSGLEWSNPSVMYLRTTYRNELARWREASADKRHGTKYRPRNENAPQAKCVSSTASIQSMGAIAQTDLLLEEHRGAKLANAGSGYEQAKKSLAAIGIMLS